MYNYPRHVYFMAMSELIFSLALVFDGSLGLLFSYSFYTSESCIVSTALWSMQRVNKKVSF